MVGPALGVGERSHAAVLRAAMDRVRVDLTSHDLPSIVMAHAFVAGGTTTESEREIAVGGVSVVPADVFNGVTYAALGHLHRPQWVRDDVAYSGSPLAMSFGEADQIKSVSLLDLTATGVSVEAIPTPVPRRLAVLRGDLADLLTNPSLEWARGAWCRAVLITDPVRPLAAYEQLTRRFPDLLHLSSPRAVGRFTPRAGMPLASPPPAPSSTSAATSSPMCARERPPPMTSAPPWPRPSTPAGQPGPRPTTKAWPTSPGGVA